MLFLIVSFLAGVISVLTPCILPLLPVVIGSTATARSRATPYIIVGSLALSVILFTYLLKVSTAFVNIPAAWWSYLSGGILAIFGATLVFPLLWEAIPGMASLSASSNKTLGAGYTRQSLTGDILVGAALGPVFSTCSPTYFVILASVLPASFLLGTLYLLSYVLGLSLVLLLLGLLGEKLSRRLTAAADPRGWFKRSLGVLFIVLGISVMFGYEKKLEAALLSGGSVSATQWEQKLLERVQ